MLFWSIVICTSFFFMLCTFDMLVKCCFNGKAWNDDIMMKLNHVIHLIMHYLFGWLFQMMVSEEKYLLFLHGVTNLCQVFHLRLIWIPPIPPKLKLRNTFFFSTNQYPVHSHWYAEDNIDFCDWYFSLQSGFTIPWLFLIRFLQG